MHRGDVVVERVDDEAERDVALVLGRAAVQHQQAGGGGLLAQRVEQRALADPGLAEHGQDAALALPDAGEELVRGGQLALAADEAVYAGLPAHAEASAPAGVGATSASIVATRPSQPEKSVSLPSAAVTRPARASSSTRSSMVRCIVRSSTDGSFQALRPRGIEASPKPVPPCLAWGDLRVRLPARGRSLGGAGDRTRQLSAGADVQLRYAQRDQEARLADPALEQRHVEASAC